MNKRRSQSALWTHASTSLFDDLRGVAGGNAVIWDGLRHDGTCSDDTFASHVSHDQCAITNPGVLADRDGFIDPALILYTNVQSRKVMLTLATHDVDVTPQKHVVLQAAGAYIAVGADIHSTADFDVPAGKESAEVNHCLGMTLFECEAVESDA